MNRVNVYRFWVSDPGNTKSVLGPRSATAETIARIERAKPIKVTAEDVDEYRVDQDGYLVS